MKKKFFKAFLYLGLFCISGWGFAQILVNSDGSVKIGDLEQTNNVTGNSVDIAVKSIYFRPATNSAAAFSIYNNSMTQGGIIFPMSSSSASPMWNAVNKQTVIEPINAGGIILGTAAHPIGSIQVQVLNTYGQNFASDRRIKENIKNLGCSWDRILSLRPVSFDYKYELLHLTPDQAMDRVGFIAQEVNEIFPSLVKYDSTVDIYTMDYVSLIPYMVKGMQEMDSVIKMQQVLLEEYKESLRSIENLLENMINEKETTGTFTQRDLDRPTKTGNVASVDCARLLQNAPNPFNGRTWIGYELPSSMRQGSAYIVVYDMKGIEVGKMKLPQEEKGRVLFEGAKLTSGVYVYTLIINGLVVDAKQMMVNE